MSKRPKLAEKEPTLEETFVEIKDGLVECKALCDKLNVTWDVESLAQLYSITVEVDDVDEFVKELELSRGVIAGLVGAEVTTPMPLKDVLTILFLTYGDDNEE